ncbi:hypothetical protein [Mucilaginibacter xinganensis]|uniref:Uncharacterized protein n=1 Tax=Mucilaginibacter xinganensis TaxID=1234841 RepID=A0A223NXQ5_9SPHI|nr:hypothetical protein [Mucilaginibacter xinganensis]ASU34351.1 hypothetical protein MuYL_2464 [Mucilaginibacter xinganensis]
MKVLIMLVGIILFFKTANGQNIFPTEVISIKDMPFRNINSKKIIGTIHAGDTVYLKNIRIAPYYYIEFHGKDVLINSKDLDSAKNLDYAVNYLHNQVKLISKLIKKYGKKYGPLVVAKDITIGMTEDMILDIKDGKYPTIINSSHYSFGDESQWVYRDDFLPSATEYYYFRNGRLTSWQD